MTISPGEEFRIKATPSPALWRKLAYLAAAGSDSVLTSNVQSGGNTGASARKTQDADMMASLAQILDQQRRREQQITEFNDRLDALDLASVEALREAQERLDEIRRTANRAKDGRLVFEDGDDGKIYDEHDTEVAADQIDRVQWNSDAPKRSDLKDARRDLEQAAEFREKVQDAKDRLASNPADEDLAAMAEELDALEESMPGNVAGAYISPGLADRDAARVSTSAAKLYDGDHAPGQGTLRAPFSGAATTAEPSEAERPAVTPGTGPAPG